MFAIPIGFSDTCTVRFHTVRGDQPSWLSDDLEGYLEEAVMLVAVPGDD